MIGETILHYKIHEKLGEGGMGVVYKAEDTKLKREVAIKFLPHHISADDEDRKRFQIEAQAAAALNHTNIAQVYSIEETENSRGEKEIFIVMEFVDGENLKTKLGKDSLSTSEAVRLAIQICEGLEAAHKKRITHRDIKAQNIMINNDGNVKIMDFGLAKVSGASQLTKVGSTVGTIAYMSPEQASGEDVDNRADIWAFGVVLYELLSGHQPFSSGYEQAVIYSILNEQPTPITNYVHNCSSTLEKIVKKCLEKKRENRYQSIKDVLNDLEMYEVDPDYGFRTKTLELKSNKPKLLKGKKVYLIPAAIILIIALSFMLPEIWQKIRNIAGWNSTPEEQHLVILPLTNIGGDKSKQAFCEGLMQTLASNITQIEQFKNSLWVVPASEVIQNKITSAGEAYKRYGVNLAITGSVQFYDGNLKLNLNLVDAKNLRQLNSTIIEVSTKNISTIDNKAVINMLEMLHIEMDPQLKDILGAGKTSVPQAYEYYVRGIGNLQQYQNMTNLEEAARLLKLAIQSDSNYALAYAALGEAYWHNYDQTKNITFVSLSKAAAVKGYKLDSTIAPINVTLGMIYNGTGEYENAILHFKKALSKDPTDAAAFRGLAKAYQSENKTSEAELTYKQAIKLKPDYWAGYNDLGKFYYNQGKFDEAIEEFKKVIKYTPNNYRGYSNVGAMYYFLDRLVDARDMFEQSLNIQPNYNTYSNLGVLYYKEENFARAVKMFEEALSINDKDYLMWANLAAAQNFTSTMKNESQSSYKKAIALAEKELRVNPNDADVMSNLAAYYADINDSTMARQLMIKSLNIAPDNSSVLYRAATINEHFNNREKALYWIRKALESGFSRSEIEQEPELKDLVSDSRYKQLVAELNKNNKN